MKQKIIEIFEKHHDSWEDTFDGDRLPGCMYDIVADEILELVCQFIRNKEDEFIEEDTSVTPYHAGILSGMEQILDAIQL